MKAPKLLPFAKLDYNQLCDLTMQAGYSRHDLYHTGDIVTLNTCQCCGRRVKTHATCWHWASPINNAMIDKLFAAYINAFTATKTHSYAPELERRVLVVRSREYCDMRKAGGFCRKCRQLDKRKQP